MRKISEFSTDLKLDLLLSSQKFSQIWHDCIFWNCKTSDMVKASFIYDVVQSAAEGYRGPKQQQVQMASANHVGAAVLVHVARRGRLDDATS